VGLSTIPCPWNQLNIFEDKNYAAPQICKKKLGYNKFQLFVIIWLIGEFLCLNIIFISVVMASERNKKRIISKKNRQQGTINI
jgi:hypothetical protein